MSDIYGLSKNSRFTVEGNYMTGNDFNITNANQPTKLVRLGLDGMIPSNLYTAGGGGAGTVVSVNQQTPDGSGNVTVTTDNMTEGTTNKYMRLPINISDVSTLGTSLLGKVTASDTNYCKTVNNLTCTNNNISLTTDNITEGTNNKYMHLPILQTDVSGLTTSLSGFNTSLSSKADLVNGVVPNSQIPPLAITTTKTYADYATMTADSSMAEGDVGICTDTNRVYMKTSSGWQTIAYNSSSAPISDVNSLTPDGYGHLSFGVNNLSNVTISSVSNSQGLIYSSSTGKWINKTIEMSDVNGLSTTLSPLTMFVDGAGSANGACLLDANGKVSNSNISTSLSGLTDCNITSVNTGNYLMYGGSSKWINTFPLRTILNTTVSLNITNAHANNLIIFNNGANSLVVIPADTSIPVGFTFDVVRWQTYKVQFYAATDVTIVSEGNKTYINDTYQCVTCTKINTSHGWLLCGALSAT